jgi:hypothetical protein
LEEIVCLDDEAGLLRDASAQLDLAHIAQWLGIVEQFGDVVDLLLSLLLIG